MSNGALRLLAGAGGKDDPVYVDDVFSTDLYYGNNGTQTINNGSILTWRRRFGVAKRKIVF